MKTIKSITVIFILLMIMFNISCNDSSGTDNNTVNGNTEDQSPTAEKVKKSKPDWVGTYKVDSDNPTLYSMELKEDLTFILKKPNSLDNYTGKLVKHEGNDTYRLVFEKEEIFFKNFKPNVKIGEGELIFLINNKKVIANKIDDEDKVKNR